MTQLTMGQRIATRRKLVGLTQEELAEKLEVSRQAVSKWESDSAIPEVDKLIALGRVFSVSVGWILGTEGDPVSRPEEGFSDRQLKMLEDIVSRSKTKKRRLLWASAAVAMAGIAVISVILWNVFDRIAELSNANMIARQQLSQLSQNNDAIQAQIDDVTELLYAQAISEQLLEDISFEAYSSDDLKTITQTLYLKPKLYQQSNTAYVSIKNPYTGYSDILKCTWNGAHYILRHTVDAADGYQFTFMLVNDYGYKEEDLNKWDHGLAHLGVYSGFHLQDDEECIAASAVEYSLSDAVYAFNRPIHTAHIFAKTAVAYRDIVLKLYCNSEVIWERSYKEEFRAKMEGSALNTGYHAVLPQVEVDLSDLIDGDRLELILEAETVNGGAETQIYRTVLDVAKYKHAEKGEG